MLFYVMKGRKSLFVPNRLRSKYEASFEKKN